jgi:hypothetical protein
VGFRLTHVFVINTGETGREKCAICQKCISKKEEYLHAWIGSVWAARATYAKNFHLKCFYDEYNEVLKVIMNGNKPKVKQMRESKNSRIKGVVKRLT